MRLAVLTLLALALLATPAHAANRAYGAFEPFTDLFTLELSDDGRELRAVALRIELDCGDGFVFPWSASLKASRRTAAATVRNRNTLVVKRGTTVGRLSGRWGTRAAYYEYTGTIALTKVKARTARVKVALKQTDSTGEERPCRLNRTLDAQREPGVLFVGATDDEEPVWARLQGNSVAWISGFGVECKPEGFMQGLHMNAAALNDATSFGWPDPLEGFQYIPYGQEPYAQAVQINGTLNGSRASGTFRIIGSGGPQNAESCDTGVRKWRALAS